MEYEYKIYAPGKEEELAAEIYSEEPLPHIQVGHFLLLESPQFSMMPGQVIEILRVAVYLFAPVDRAPPKAVRIHVYTRLQESAEGFNR